MDEITGTTEAGAAPVTTTAEASGQVPATSTDNTTGAAPGTVPAEAQGGQDDQTTTQEGTEGAPEGTQKAPHQTTLEERVQQLAERRITEAEQRLRAEFQQVTQAKAAEAVDFIPDIDLDKVNDHIRTTLEQIEDLKAEGRMLDALDLQDGLNALRQELKANDQRKAAWLQRTQAQRQQAEYQAQHQKNLNDAAAFYFPRKGYTPEVIEAGRQFFVQSLQTDPLLNARYQEIGYIQGPLAAMEFIEKYLVENMGKKQETLIQQKEAAKQTLPPGKTSTGEPVGNANLEALRKQASSGSASDLAAYMAAKKAAATT